MTIRYRSVNMTLNVIRFGNECLACRLETGMTTEDASVLLPFDKSTLLTYERGDEPNMKMQNFLALCNLWDLDPREYFELER